MVSYPLDIDAVQVVRWLMDDTRADGPALSVVASRTYQRETIANARQARLGENETADLSEVTVIGVLEVTPAPPHDGWLLRIRVEDPVGPRLTGDEPSAVEDEEIDLATFYEQFLDPESGAAFVSLEAGDDAARERFDALLANILTDRHPGRA